MEEDLELANDFGRDQQEIGHKSDAKSIYA